MNAEAIFAYGAEPKITVDCPVCRTSATRSQVVHDRYGYQVPFTVCEVCSLGYLQEQMTRDGYMRFYAGGYRALIAARSGGPRLRQSTHSSVPTYRDIITQLVGVKPIQTMLDAGGSTGVIGSAVAEAYRADLTVLDPAVQELPATGRTITGWLEDPLPGQYDLAICIAMSDHLTDPIKALTNLRQVAKYLYIDFIDVLMSQQFGRKLKLKIDHPLYWTAKAMRRALAQTGWMMTNSRVIGHKAKYQFTGVACQ